MGCPLRVRIDLRMAGRVAAVKLEARENRSIISETPARTTAKDQPLLWREG
jgi:hypothetical protein